MSNFIEGLVVLQTGGFVDVEVVGGDVVRCRLRGRLKQADNTTDLCVIGDRVRISGMGEGASVEEVLPRHNRFSRAHPVLRGGRREDVLVANLDVVLIVVAASLPKPSPRLVDRFLVIAERQDIEAVIVLTKMDEPDADESLALFAPHVAVGYTLIPTSIVDGRGLEALGDVVRGRISTLVGPSGSGKSSLANVLVPGLSERVGSTNAANKGRHTTRVATLHPMANSGYLADTPGIRELATFALPEAELDACFRELRPYLGECKFRSCRHVSEPGCAVRSAVDRNEIHASRYESYVKLLRGDERAPRSDG
jgi:ribosome biogenesis GTPase